MAPKKEALTYNTVDRFDYERMIEELMPLLLTDIDGTPASAQAANAAQVMMATLANQYSFIESLKMRMSWVASQFTSRTDRAYKVAVQKRDALDSITTALKLKHTTISKMLWIIQESDAGPRGWSGIPARR